MSINLDADKSVRFCSPPTSGIVLLQELDLELAYEKRCLQSGRFSAYSVLVDTFTSRKLQLKLEANIQSKRLQWRDETVAQICPDHDSNRTA
jgi:hypothetical protein